MPEVPLVGKGPAVSWSRGGSCGLLSKNQTLANSHYTAYWRMFKISLSQGFTLAWLVWMSFQRAIRSFSIVQWCFKYLYVLPLRSFPFFSLPSPPNLIESEHLCLHLPSNCPFTKFLKSYHMILGPNREAMGRRDVGNSVPAYVYIGNMITANLWDTGS